MRELIVQWQEGGQDHTHVVTGGHHVRIGRQQDCEIVLQAPTVSRRHAEIFQDAGGWVVRNTSGTNPVEVGSKRLQQGEQAPLKEGETFRVGPVHFLVIGPTVAEAEGEAVPKLKCPRCGNIWDYAPEQFCGVCGMALSAGQTVFVKE